MKIKIMTGFIILLSFYSCFLKWELDRKQEAVDRCVYQNVEFISTCSRWTNYCRESLK